ncbi:MAG: hypothetical protein ACT4O1_10780 [Gemmatimonadota bacterium]
MGKVWGALALLMIALFMLIGFVRSGADGITAAEIVAFIMVVLVPGFFGIKLLRDYFGRDQRVEANKADLRQRTLNAEVLRLAGAHGGKLTIVEVVTALAITADEAKQVLDNLAREGLADFQVTDAGVLVYDFQDIRRLGDKSTAKGILE